MIICKLLKISCEIILKYVLCFPFSLFFSFFKIVSWIPFFTHIIKSQSVSGVWKKQQLQCCLSVLGTTITLNQTKVVLTFPKPKIQCWFNFSSVRIMDYQCTHMWGKRSIFVHGIVVFVSSIDNCIIKWKREAY